MDRKKDFVCGFSSDRDVIKELLRHRRRIVNLQDMQELVEKSGSIIELLCVTLTLPVISGQKSAM